MKQEVVTVGLDLAKSVLKVHAIGGNGTILVRRAPAGVVAHERR